MKRIIFLFLTAIIIISSSVLMIAHPGGTDSYGGHNGPDGYHYHHGYPAHNHTDLDGDGKLDCPYGYKDNTKDNSSASSIKNKNNIPSNKNGHNSFYIKHTSLHILTVISLSIMIIVFIIAIICKIKYDDPITANLYGAGIAALSGIFALNAYYLPSLLSVICYLAIMLGSLPLLLVVFFLTPMYIKIAIEKLSSNIKKRKERKKQLKSNTNINHQSKPKRNISTGAVLIILSLVLWIIPIAVGSFIDVSMEGLLLSLLSMTVGSILGLIGTKTL